MAWIICFWAASCGTTFLSAFDAYGRLPGRSSGWCTPAGAVKIVHGDLREPFGEFAARERAVGRLLAGGKGRNGEAGAGGDLGRPARRTRRRERSDSRYRGRLGHR